MNQQQNEVCGPIVQTENIDVAMGPQLHGTVAQSDEQSQNHIQRCHADAGESEVGTEVENSH